MKNKMTGESGSIVVSVLWMLAVLGVFTMAVSRQAAQELLLGKWMRDRVEGRTLARAGVERALLELQTDEFRAFDAMNEAWSSNDGAFRDATAGPGVFSVTCKDQEKIYYGACDESARLNLNRASETHLKNLFQAVDPALADDAALSIAQAIVDWRDGDDAELASGAEKDYYRALAKPYQPRNADLQSVEELSMVKGVTPALFEKIRRFVTVYSTGKVNLNTAPPEVLQALGFAAETASKIAEFRRGIDKETGTRDDEVFQDASAIAETLSASVPFSADEFAAVQTAVEEGALDVKSQVFRIQASGHLRQTGKSHDMMVTCVAKRDGTILYWREGAFF